MEQKSDAHTLWLMQRAGSSDATKVCCVLHAEYDKSPALALGQWLKSNANYVGLALSGLGRTILQLP